MSGGIFVFFVGVSPAAYAFYAAKENTADRLPAV